jgi:hypothetical protein
MLDIVNCIYFKIYISSLFFNILIFIEKDIRDTPENLYRSILANFVRANIIAFFSISVFFTIGNIDKDNYLTDTNKIFISAFLSSFYGKIREKLERKIDT